MAKAKEKTMVLERTYTIPLRKEWSKAPRYKRAKKAVKTIKVFLAKHMKVSERNIKKVKIDSWVNHAVWVRGIKKPPQKINVKAIKDSEGNVKVEFVGLPPKFKIEEEKLKKKIEKSKKKEEVKEKERKKLEEEKKRKKEEEKKKTGEKEKAEEKEEKKEKEETEKEEKKEKEKALHKEITKARPEIRHEKIKKQAKPVIQRKALEK